MIGWTTAEKARQPRPSPRAGPRSSGQSGIGYRLAVWIGRSIFVQTIRIRALRPEAPNRPGGYLLAISHLSHLEPFCVGIHMRRRVEWMTRIEFYRYRLIAFFLNRLGCFPVRRFGVPVSAIRNAIDRVRRGRVVGIFPEGGCARGSDSVLRGGPIKKGVCLIAMRAEAPVLPCVVLGTEKLNAADAWMPMGRGRLWIAYGARMVYPPAEFPDRRSARRIMAEELRAEFMSLYAELREQFGIRDQDVP